MQSLFSHINSLLSFILSLHFPHFLFSFLTSTFLQYGIMSLFLVHMDPMIVDLESSLWSKSHTLIMKKFWNLAPWINPPWFPTNLTLVTFNYPVSIKLDDKNYVFWCRQVLASIKLRAEITTIHQLYIKERKCNCI